MLLALMLCYQPLNSFHLCMGNLNLSFCDLPIGAFVSFATIINCSFSCCLFLYSFPRAAITKCYKLDGLRQQKFILSHFWSLESKTKVWQDYTPKASRKISSLASGSLGDLGLQLYESLLSSHKILPVSVYSSFPPHKDTSHAESRARSVPIGSCLDYQ